MDRRNINRPEGMKVPEDYWDSIKADHFMKTHPEGMIVPPDYFVGLDAQAFIQKALQEEKTTKKEKPIIQITAAYRAIIATAAAILCLLWIDSLQKDTVELADLSTADLELVLLMESEYLLTQNLDETGVESMEDEFAPYLEKTELENEILNEIENLDLWYD